MDRVGATGQGIVREAGNEGAGEGLRLAHRLCGLGGLLFSSHDKLGGLLGNKKGFSSHDKLGGLLGKKKSLLVLLNGLGGQLNNFFLLGLHFHGSGRGGKGVGNFLLGLGNLLSRQLKHLLFGGSLEGGKELSDEGRALFVLLHRPDHTVMDVLKGGVTGAAIGVGDRYVVAYLIAACVEDLEEGEIGLGGDLQG